MPEARAAFAPERDDARDVGGGSQGGGLGAPQAHVHAELIAQGREAGMHFCGRGTRPRPRQRIGRPHARMAFGQILGDGERIPDQRRAVVQTRHAAAG